MENLPRQIESALVENGNIPISDWVKNALNQAKEVQIEPFERSLAQLLISQAYQISKKKNCNIGLSLAASFDLFIAAQYYKSVAHKRWYYCPKHNPALFYPFTNTCPRCILDNQFYFETAHKPESGSIGQATSRLLSVFLYQLFEKFNRPMKIYRGVEPVDMIVFDPITNVVLLAEIKAAPLVTLPLMVLCDQLTEINEKEELINVDTHESTDNHYLSSSDLYLFLPMKNVEQNSRLVNLGQINIEDRNWSYKSVEQVLNTDLHFFEDYFDFWIEAFEAYQTNYQISRHSSNQRSESNFFWFTNACGQPYPRPAHWPRRPGTGFESVSDGKTSVGMDRTDDIKKGIYQVLKVATESKPNQANFEVKTALISNIHAVRHYSDYLTSLENVMWLVDKRTNKSSQIKKVGDLPDDYDVYNLFDGIISFTESHLRDGWIRQNFSF